MVNKATLQMSPSVRELGLPPDVIMFFPQNWRPAVWPPVGGASLARTIELDLLQIGRDDLDVRI
jgi:hypothetical protein